MLLFILKKCKHRSTHILPCMRDLLRAYSCKGSTTSVLLIVLLVTKDSKLEQSINKFLKGQGGYVCIGVYDDVSAVAEFELLFYEILKIKNLINHFIGNKLIWQLETSIKHSLHGSKIVQVHKNVQLFDVVNGKGNPYENIRDIQPRLHKLMTKQS